jgi:hypothetical protein
MQRNLDLSGGLIWQSLMLELGSRLGASEPDLVYDAAQAAATEGCVKAAGGG